MRFQYVARIDQWQRADWTEQDWLVTDERIEFKQTDGDLEVWYGEWLLIQREDGLHVDLNVTFDLGIPSLAEVLHPIGERAIRANNVQMLDGIRNQLLARRHQRVAAGAADMRSTLIITGASGALGSPVRARLAQSASGVACDRLVPFHAGGQSLPAGFA